MIKTVHPSIVKGTITAPSSKSLTQRAIAAALLAHGTTVISNPSFCNDSLAAIEMAKRLGASVSREENSIKITGTVKTLDDVILNCGESGLALRMFSPIAALLSNKCLLKGEGSLINRPVSMITDALLKLGVGAESNKGFLPLTLNGHLKGGRIEIDGSLSSQLLTGLLMALPLADNDSEIIVNNLKSKPYVNLTLQLLNIFGITVDNEDYKRFIVPGNQVYESQSYSVEGDWSGAAFILVAGAVAGEAKVNNLFPDSKQADVAILEALKRAGATISFGKSFVKTTESSLKSFDFDATESPDLFPPLACLAINCKGQSRLKGVSRLEHKESNRALSIVQVLNELGVRASVRDDEMIIEGGEVTGATVSSHNDHRIAMMAAVASLRSNKPVIITDAEAVSKSYPGFYLHLGELGAEIS